MKNDLKNYATIIPYKIIELVPLISDNRKLEFIDSVNYLYNSELYNKLSIETTKLWHLSAMKLFSMLEEEKTSNEFKYPDFV